ncbi:RNA binding motif protein 39b [Hyaloraphidium curvatum]|nr:RNA binding motif protein 39b [Hyaloraphidium curvatum]
MSDDVLQLIEAPFRKQASGDDAAREKAEPSESRSSHGHRERERDERDGERSRRESDRRREDDDERRHSSSKRKRSPSEASDGRRREKDRHRRDSRSRSRRRERSREDRRRDESRGRDDRSSHRSRRSDERSERANGSDGRGSRRNRSRDGDSERRRRESSRDADRRHDDRRRSPDPSRRAPVKRPASPPLSDLERDKRTVFCMQLAARLREKELSAFFESVGRVRDARIITDRNSGRSKGVGYVEFYEESSVPAAIALTGQKLLGIPIIVTLTESEKNRLAEAEKAAQALAAGISVGGRYGTPVSRLYIGNVHFNLTEVDIRQVFEPFGPVESVSLHLETDGRSKGYAFVQFKHTDDARKALEQMNGFELAGRQLKVEYVAEKALAAPPASSLSLSIDEGETNFAMNAQTRAELMQKLAARSSSDLFQPQPKPKPQSSSIRLTNMFDPEEETEPNWDEEIAEDVASEAGKYGKVVKLRVDKNSQGHVYITFDSPASAQSAIAALNGRWFSGKQVVASVVPDSSV